MVFGGAAADNQKELKVLIWDFGSEYALPYDSNYWFDYIQKNFGDPNGIKVTFVPMVRSEETTTLNVWMASGDVADIVYTYYINLVQNYLRMGGLADLTDAVAQYGSHLIDYIGAENQQTGNINGKQMLSNVVNGYVGFLIANASSGFPQGSYYDQMAAK